MTMLLRLLSICMLLFVSSVRANVIRCDLIDPHSRESELCWKQLLYKNYPIVPQMDEDQSDPELHGLQARNSELSSALMQLYGFNRLNGKRNPEFSRDVVRFISDINPYKEN